MIAIYKITSPTGKVYIGQSWDIARRKREYNRLSCKKQIKLHASIKKHNWVNHQFDIIVEFPSDVNQEIMDNYEKLYWSQYLDLGFDMMNIKEPGKGGKLAQSTKDKISAKAKGRIFTEDHKRNLSLSHIGSSQNKGRVLTDEHKKKIGESKLGNLYNKGRKMSEYNKIKLAEGRRNSKKITNGE